jgi:colanic acid biosynthesis glycosyl transferase WcaI
VKIGMITQWFAPEQFPLPNSLSEQSVRAGDEVTVLTGFPSYPFGKIYSGYSQVSDFHEVIAGANVYRVKSFLSHDSSAINRIRTFASFALSSTRKSSVLAKTDVNYVYATPMSASMAAWWRRKRNGVPYVLHIQDLWPESVSSSGMLSKGPISSMVGTLISALLRPIYSAASHIIVISPSMRTALVNRGVDGSKITKVLNWDPDSVECSDDHPMRSSSHRVRFVYAGNLGVMQDVATILGAADLLRNNPQVEIHIYGSGVLEASLQQMAADANLGNVTFHGRVAKETMSEVYAASDFQLVTLKDDPLFRMTIPSKFQAAMAHGIPVVSTVQGDLQSICHDAGVGWTAQAEDPASLAEAISLAAAVDPVGRKAMNDSCLELYRNELSPDKGIAAVRKILEDVVILKGRNGS